MPGNNKVADAIETNVDSLIAAWVECVQKNVPASKDKSPLVLINHLKDFFHTLIKALRDQDFKLQNVANFKLSEDHGKQRAGLTDYSINQVIQEYHLLRTTIFDFLDERAPVGRRERNIINEFIDDFIRTASATFSDELRKRLTDALKMRDDFISTISHELKTPLTSMKLQTQISKRNIVKRLQGAAPVEGIIRFIDQKEKGINRLNHLVEDMLDSSRINSGKLRLEKEDFVLSDAVQEVLAEMAPYLAECRSTIHTDVPEGVHLYCDKFRFEQILINLLSNAAKYGAGGSIELVAHLKKDEIVIEVQDHGRGIHKKDQERIFQRFERVNSPGERNGLGLGLYIVRQLTNMLGGRIWLKSKVGKGSNFILQLPLQS